MARPLVVSWSTWPYKSIRNSNLHGEWSWSCGLHVEFDSLREFAWRHPYRPLHMGFCIPLRGGLWIVWADATLKMPFSPITSSDWSSISSKNKTKNIAFTTEWHVKSVKRRCSILVSWFEFDLHCLGWHIVDILHKKRCTCRLSVAGHRWMHTVHSLCRCLFEIQQWTRGWSWVCSGCIKDRLHTWWPLWMGTRTCSLQLSASLNDFHCENWDEQQHATTSHDFVVKNPGMNDIEWPAYNTRICLKTTLCFAAKFQAVSTCHSGPPPKPPPGNSAIASMGS